MTCVQCNVKLFCVIFTRLTLLEYSNIINLLQTFVCSNHPLILLIPWAMNCQKIWEKLRLIHSLPHSHYQGNLERRTPFFSLEFVNTYNNNLNLANYLKISIKSSRRISFKMMSPSINYASLIIKILNQIEVEDEKNLLQEFWTSKNIGCWFSHNHNEDYENVMWKWWQFFLYMLDIKHTNE